MLGKIRQVAKYINNDDSVKGVHPLTDEIKNVLQSKHPAGREADQEVILEHTSETPSACHLREHYRRQSFENC